MIIFATYYDACTEGGYIVAQLIPHGPKTTRLLGSAATGGTLKQSLGKSEATPLLAFTHGKPTHLCGQDGIPAIEYADGHIVGSRSVFAYACWTADQLGEQIAGHGAVWWGFTGEIAALPTDLRSARVLAKMFATLVADLPRVTTASRVAQYLKRVRALCESARVDLGALHRTGHRVDPYAYYCIEHILQRLRVWLPGRTVPLYDSASETPFSIPSL